MSSAFEVSLFMIQSDFLHAIKSYDTGPTALLSLRKKRAVFLSPLKIHCLGRVLTHEPWIQWQAYTITPPRLRIGLPTLPCNMPW
jgi:hypothetical protein